MPAGGVAARIRRRAGRAGIETGPELAGSLEAYLDLLSRWNRRINLTALQLEPLSDQAVDRLIVEPLVASRRVRPEDRLAIDIGSGGGSPAIPLRLACPGLRLVMTEIKVRKSAFLREVVRQLGLTDVEVANVRYEELLARADLHEAADIVSVRAVRPDAALWSAIRGLLRPGGRLFWFTTTEARQPALNWSFNQIHSDRLGASASRSELVVAEIVR
ncbi:MAG: RsmG family class I SAM-dependent methyltransferase [Vicinamibacterales bacterium]